MAVEDTQAARNMKTTRERVTALSSEINYLMDFLRKCPEDEEFGVFAVLMACQAQRFTWMHMGVYYADEFDAEVT